MQDMTYGFNSLDGFVTYYNADSDTWSTSSLIVEQEEYDISQTDLNLTDTATWVSDGNWDCEVTLEDTDSPTYE